MAQRRAKDIEEKEETRRHKKAPQPLYDQRKQAAVSEDSQTEPAEAVLNLQQTYGNRYVQRVMGKVQAKLIVNPPDDQYEKEADRVADAVTKASTSNIQRQEKGPEKENLVATKPTSEKQRQPFAVSGDMEADITAARGDGQPLPDSVRSSLEPQLGHDFSQVHIHTDAKANKLSQQLGAEAFTSGNDVFFIERAYQPGSDSGRGLIAHELTHVVQQGAARVSRQAAEMEGAATDPKEEAKSELKDVVNKIKTKLERGYIEALLRIAVNCQAQGMEESAYKWAMEEAVEAASTVLKKKKTAGLDVKSAKKEMVTELLNAAAEVMKLGGDDKAVESALKKALDWAEAQLASAMRKLETALTKANAREVAAKAAQVALLGGDPAEAWEALKKWEEESGKKGQIK
jgi:hypothetical protein